MKYRIEATIPTQQYGNIRPTFEVDENEPEVLGKLEQLWNMFGENKLPKRTELGTLLTTFTGEQVYYNDDTHSYYDLKGNELLSGSKYAKQFAKPFDEDFLAKKVSDKTGEPEELIKSKWKLSGSISTSFGTSVHDSVEFILLGGDIEKTPQPVRESVNRIIDTVRGFEMTPITEVLVSDVDSGNVGRIDCLLVDDPENPEHFIILDYKTNRELSSDKKKVYTKQLEFYRDILVHYGLKCKGMFLIHEDGTQCVTYPLDK
jgi:hypothetical protein